MKILLTGASGQLGTELIPRLQKLGEVMPVDLDCAACISKRCRPLDMTDGGALETVLNRFQPDLVVNAGAFTAVDLAEKAPRTAFAVNAEAPGRMARWVSRNDAFLMHYSTDYIFDGYKHEPYLETDLPEPLNVYGESKLAGERAIEASGCRHVIIRTSWVYSGHGNNFVLSMLALGRRGLELNVVNDQVGCPTWARNLADVSMQLVKKGLARRKPLQGLVHYCDADRMSWHDFARLVFDSAIKQGLLETMPRLNSVKSSQYPQIANRPAWSVLDTALAQSHGIVPARLKTSLEQCLKELPRE
ncbi:MAG: dTDP-4-dehydrorhamnose reductase [Xanthomonadales bacterium]|nr:dTDP-4-dehydrorhamnose reductase [Gammaproteobacteria bacterium]NNE05124.1 dTDP-4-dehydrorhamnose reductase [Xanthomonadales bacterium]NNL95241.1 dTDP-4-dehydrorhamnose reductase [Xanthomonadales bacterium]